MQSCAFELSQTDDAIMMKQIKLLKIDVRAARFSFKYKPKSSSSVEKEKLASHLSFTTEGAPRPRNNSKACLNQELKPMPF